jgi:hypothetical protein
MNIKQTTLKIFSIIILLLTVFLSAAEAQKKKNQTGEELSQAEMDLWDDAEYFYEQKNYMRALQGFEQLVKAHPKDAYFNYMAGVCYLHKSDEKEKSLLYLLRADSIDHSLLEIDYFLGRANHLNYKFDEAIIYFNSFIGSKPKPDKIITAQRYIEYCKNGKKLVDDEVEAQIDNIGNIINTAEQEYVPTISSDESVMIFTYRGKKSTGGLMNAKFESDKDGDYYEDVFISTKVDDQWIAPQSIGININTKNHDANIALSPDGQMLFIFRSTSKDKGDIYVSKLNGSTWGVPVRMGESINTKYWEGSVTISSDGKTLYFASEKPGGLGMRDLYRSYLLPNGQWSKAENLGPKINTPYNDDAPFLHVDGHTLFFSSEGHSSMGGYDVFYSSLDSVGAFTSPENLGFPVNTTEDDIYYVINADGERGYFASNRKGGFGQQDIYTVTPGFKGKKPVLALIVGFVKKDGNPVNANITLTDNKTGENKGTFNSNSSTGKYLIALTPGVEYKVAFEVEGQQQIEYVNVSKIETFVQADFNVNFYSEEYKTQNNIAVDTASNIQNSITQQLNKFNSANKTELCEAKVYKNILTEFGMEMKENVYFTVELGTYENPKDFNPDKIRPLGAIESRVDALGHTTFYIGNYQMLSEADRLKSKVLKTDSSFTTAIVSVNDNGKFKLITKYYEKEYINAGCNAMTEVPVIKNKSGGIIGLQDDAEYKQIVKDNGTKQIEGLEYKIEICSTKDSTIIGLDKLKKYGEIQKKTYPDGVTRYTMGPFKTLNEAEAFKLMLIENEPDFGCSFVTVFYFGQRKTVKEQFNGKPPVKDGPCETAPPMDYSFFKGKDLNDTAVYNRLVRMTGNYCFEGIIFKVQIGAYRFPQNFKYPQVEEFGPAEIIKYEDGITRFTLKQFKTLKEAEAFRQVCIKKGIKDAWVTAVYQNKRVLLSDLINVNFYGQTVN